jgi:ornithine cyclodeaminase
MKYLSDVDITNLRPSWKEMCDVITDAIETLSLGDYAQPIKPYLQYRCQENRIIAMPAFLGGKTNFAGIKWIASFPKNLEIKKPRAHAITVLNNSDTGEPQAIFNANQLSGLRTAAVSGVVLLYLMGIKKEKNLNVGICGFGPIGQLHAEMVRDLFPEQISQIKIFDINLERRNLSKENAHFQKASSWEEAYRDADIFITCTNSSKRYINILPKKGSIHLNVSLRDYQPDVVKESTMIIVDDWDEVCRENTDIEVVKEIYGLDRNGVCSLEELIGKKRFDAASILSSLERGFLSFHPMGMAVFDIAMAGMFVKKAERKNVGVRLPF